MNIIEVRSLAIPEIKVIRVERYRDHRGHFLESFRAGDLARHAPFIGTADGPAPFVQGNASFSRAGTVRGMHFQWDPPMGKLVRTVHGRMIDLVLDVRPASATFGCMLTCDMPVDEAWADLIWVPPGFAHGNAFPVDTCIEYLCTAEYNPRCEAAVSPLSDDIDWSLAEPRLAAEVRALLEGALLITEKDRTAQGVRAWARDARAASAFQSSGVRR